METLIYYKVISKDGKFELRRNAGLHEYYYTYEDDGTKFAVALLDKVKELAERFNGNIYEVTEKRLLIE